MKKIFKTKLTHSAGGVVVGEDGKILIINQRGTSWSLPKGHIEKNEKAVDAAKREIYEESGIKDLDFVKNLGSYQRYKIGINNQDDKTDLKTIEMFLFKTKTKDLKPIDPENPEALWLNKKEVANKLTHSKDKEFFLKIKGDINL